jgi:hypothetical protein
VPTGWLLNKLELVQRLGVEAIVILLDPSNTAEDDERGKCGV